jgi:hypothetical protein
VAAASAAPDAPSYAPCPCHSICITCSLLLGLPRCRPRVGGMFSRQHQQTILSDGVLLMVPFVFYHYTHLIDG